MPAPLGGPGSRISTSNSPGFRTVVNGPLKNFRAGTERLPPLDCSTNVASSTSMTGGMAAADRAGVAHLQVADVLRHFGDQRVLRPQRLGVEQLAVGRRGADAHPGPGR